jgi:hypothetical protein
MATTPKFKLPKAQAASSRRPMRRILGDLNQVLLTQIQWLDALVCEHEKLAYTHDRYGTVANPAAPGELRDLMHQFAELTFQRDGRYPRWWRAVDEQPDY